ncbi:hypothetical protein ACFWBF_15715 [Streptomyces sp. NPDC060028]|uniref:hypothetical protein n=1 Tax=Streptomyces sp. NPDC060028 TaxID=3347041 RepID=UPI0036C83575
MIGEPELAEDWPEGGPAGAARPGPAGGAGEAGEAAVRGPVRPWLGALGGAVLASAVWAGAWVVQDRFADAGPPIAYRHSQDLCGSTLLKALGTVVGTLDERTSRHAESRALDWATCDASTKWDGNGLAYFGRMEVELHKKTDPGAEFGTGLEVDPWIGPEVNEVQQVSGLGERALLHGYMSASKLQVLDGGTVLTLTVQWHGGGGESGDRGKSEADQDGVSAAMIEDARALMDALKKK